MKFYRASLFQKRSRIWKAFFLGIGGDFLGIGIAFLSSVLFVRYAGLGVYGAYQLLFITASLGILGTSSLDQIFVRFFDTLHRKEIGPHVRAVLALKSIGYVVVLTVVVLGAMALGDRVSLVSELRGTEGIFWIALFAFVQVYLNHIATTFRAIIQRFEQYGRVVTFQIASVIVDLVSILVVLWKFPTDPGFGVLLIFGIRAVVTAVLLCIQGLYARGLTVIAAGEEEARSPGIRILWDPRWRRYTGPTQILELMTYLKRYFPVILAGAVLSLADAGKIRIILNIFDMAAKIIPKSMTLIFPGMQSKWEADQQLFEKRIRKYGALYVGLLAVGGLLVVEGGGIFYSLLKMEFAPRDLWFLCVLSIDLVAGAAMQIELQFLLFGKDMRSFLYSSPIRQSLQIGLGALLVKPFELAGLAVGRLFGTVWIWIVIVGVSRKESERSMREMRFFAFLAAGASLLIAISTLIRFLGWRG